MTNSRETDVPEIHPRLVCRSVRRWSAVSGSWKSSHVVHCAACRAYFASTRELESALRDEAAAARRTSEPSNPAFEQQLLRVIRNSAPDQTRPQWSMPRRAWGIGGLCAAAALAVMLSLRVAPTARQEPLATSSAKEDAAVIITTVESLSSGLVDSVIPKAGELVVHNPLQQELGSVYSDVRSALDFLALNFLPATRVNSPPDPTRRI